MKSVHMIQLTQILMNKEIFPQPDKFMKILKTTSMSTLIEFFEYRNFHENKRIYLLIDEKTKSFYCSDTCLNCWLSYHHNCFVDRCANFFKKGAFNDIVDDKNIIIELKRFADEEY